MVTQVPSQGFASIVEARLSRGSLLKARCPSLLWSFDQSVSSPRAPSDADVTEVWEPWSEPSLMASRSGPGFFKGDTKLIASGRKGMATRSPRESAQVRGAESCPGLPGPVLSRLLTPNRSTSPGSSEPAQRCHSQGPSQGSRFWTREERAPSHVLDCSSYLCRQLYRGLIK